MAIACNSRRLHLQPVCDLSQAGFFIGLTSFYNLRQLFENPKNLCFLLIFDPYLLILVSALEYLTPPEWVPFLSKDPVSISRVGVLARRFYIGIGTFCGS